MVGSNKIRLTYIILFHNKLIIVAATEIVHHTNMSERVFRLAKGTITILHGFRVNKSKTLLMLIRLMVVVMMIRT